MDREKLWEILYKERNTASLQELPETFCEELREYINKLEDEKIEADEMRQELIEDEIKNVRMKVEDIIKRRIGKIVKLASSGMKIAPKGMLDEEARIFKGVKSHVEEGRERISALMLGEGKSEKSDAKKSDEKDAMHFGQTVSKFNNSSNPAPISAENNEELHIVRILDDIPTFMGTDGRVYKVKKEDVIMLPKTNAEILCKRGVAVQFETKKSNGMSKGEIEK